MLIFGFFKQLKYYVYLKIMETADHRKTQVTVVTLLVGIGVLLCFYKVGDRDLWTPDEAE